MRIIVKQGRVGIVRGRVVTDAGGADCCCGPALPCPCDFTNPFTASRYKCPNLEIVPIRMGRRFGRITMVVQWQASARIVFPPDGFGTPGSSREFQSQGVGLLCVRDDSTVPLALPGSYSATRYTETVGGQVVAVVESEYGPDQWNQSPAGRFPQFPVNRIAFAGSRIVQGAFYPPDAPFQLADVFTPARASCEGTSTTADRNSGVGERRHLVKDTDLTGEGRASSRYQSFPGSPEPWTATASLVVDWRRDLSCALPGGGEQDDTNLPPTPEGMLMDGPNGPGLPAGIDPTTLRPYVPGCPGCG